MALPFLYDTHYQLDKPFSLIHLTLSTASPTDHFTDEVLARRLSLKAASRNVCADGDWAKWKINKDAMLYWVGNCQQCDLLTNQNVYGFWLMNFYWTDLFDDHKERWGEIKTDKSDFAKLLLFRWAWLFDGPALMALSWKLVFETHSTRKLVDRSGRNIEDILENIFVVLRETSQDVKENVRYRLLIERLKKKPLELNTRRHKLLTHLGLLSSVGAVTRAGEDRLPNDRFLEVVRQFPTLRDIIVAALKPSRLGQGGDLFRELASAIFHANSSRVEDLNEYSWQSYIPEVRTYFSVVENWGRKFLNIRSLAELFLVKSLLHSEIIYAPNSWPEFLLSRSRLVPDELTVHVNRFGKTEFLRLF